MDRRVPLVATVLACVSFAVMGYEADTAHYKPPRTDVTPPELSRTFDRPFEGVWNALTQAGPDTGYRLLDENEDNGTLTFGFGGLEPWRYVTGGHYRQTNKTPFREQPTPYGPVETFRGDYVKFASETRGGELQGTARVKVTRVGPQKTRVHVDAGYQYTMGDIRWSFETGHCAKQLVPYALADTPLERTLCPTYKVEKELLDLASRD
jgi:hypothetical protein